MEGSKQAKGALGKSVSDDNAEAVPIPRNDNDFPLLQDHAEHFVQQIVFESVLKATQSMPIEASSPAALCTMTSSTTLSSFTATSLPSVEDGDAFLYSPLESPQSMPAAEDEDESDSNPNADVLFAITNQSNSDSESGSQSDSDSANPLSPNQQQNKAGGGGGGSNNKRKKKNQQRRKNSNSNSSTGTGSSVSYSSSTASTSSPSVAISVEKKKSTTDLLADSPSVSSATPAAPAAAKPTAVEVPSVAEKKAQAADSISNGGPKATSKSTTTSTATTTTNTDIASVTTGAVEEIAAVAAVEPACDATSEHQKTTITTIQTKSNNQAPVTTSVVNSASVEHSPIEQQQLTKECSESKQQPTAATEASSSDQSMDVEVDSKSSKLNGAATNGSNKSYTQNGTGESICKICAKHVYQMEQIKAEKSVFHMACFRCQECKKQLKVDSYSSHEGVIYCKPHFKQLFMPKPVIVNDSSEPTSTRQEDVFENINLDLSNIRNRFENSARRESNTDAVTAAASNSRKASGEKLITRSESIHKIMQKYQSRVAGDKDTTSSDEEDNNQSSNQHSDEQQSSDKHNSSPKVAFSGMSALKSQWESGSINSNNKSEKERVEEELAELRQKVKTSEPLKQAYERAVQEAKSVENLAANKGDNHIEHSSVKAVSLKEKFEKGTTGLDSQGLEEDRAERERKEREEEISRISVGDTTCTKEARNKFKQIEANMGKDQPASNGGGHGAAIEDTISSNELQQRIKNFESIKDHQSANAKEGGDEIDANVDDIPKADTTKKMLDKFKALEASGGSSAPTNGAPKSPIRITPPRETAAKSLYESEPAAERDPNIVRSSYKTEDDIQVEPEKAKNLRAKFENWQTEIEREGRKSENEDDYVPNIDTTKNLRAMFESIKDEYKPLEKPRPRVNRFVENKAPPGEVCYVCSSRLYPMEKMEFSGIKIHKNCFRCNKCHTPLRLDNFTTTAEKLFCIPHFKQLFMEKGNYDEGFGLEQHKDKWSNKGASAPASASNGQAPAAINGQSNGVEKLENGGDGEVDDLLEIAKPVANGNGIHDDEEEEEDEQLLEQNGHHHNGGGGNGSVLEADRLSADGEDEQLLQLEEPEVQPKQKQPLQQQQQPEDDLDVLQQQVGHLDLEHEDAILDGPIPVDNLA